MLSPTRPSTIIEPEDRLTPTVAPSMPALEGRVPVLHLHRHEHPPGAVDEEARAVVQRLAGQHGELFEYLQGKIQELRDSRVHPQFVTDVTQWIGDARDFMEGQGQKLSSLNAELQATKMEVATAQEAVGRLRAEMGDSLAALENSLETSDCQLKGHIQQLSTGLTTTSDEWRQEAQHLSSQTQRLENKVLMVEVEERVERKRLQDILEDVKETPNYLVSDSGCHGRTPGTAATPRKIVSEGEDIENSSPQHPVSQRDGQNCLQVCWRNPNQGISLVAA